MARPVGGHPELIGGSPELIGGHPELIGGSPELQPSDAIDLSPRFRAWSEPTPPGNPPLVCHFLRSVGADGRLSEPRQTAIPTHRCAAFGDPLPLSLRQQELVCLQRVHVSCPRFLRGTLLASETPAAASDGPAGRATPSFPVMTIAGVAVMVLAILLLVSGVAGHFFGGAASPSMAASLTIGPSPTAQISAPSTTQPGGAASPSPVVTPTPTATASASATAPTPTGSWPPGATASRMNLVVACGDQTNCYVYTVRSGAQNGSGVTDTLPNVVKFFGVDLAKVRQMNPWLNGGSTIHAGNKLRIPPPTR